MSYTSDLDGDWSEPVKVAGGKGLPDLNVAPYIFSNGSLLALYRNNAGTNIHILSASNWRDPATYQRSEKNLSVSVPEDPFLWRDAGGVFHSLFHAWPLEAGPHAWSEDGVMWQKAPGEGNWTDGTGMWVGPARAYPRQITFTDAAPIMLGSRERPSLIFAEDGVTPLALVTGSNPDPQRKTDYCVTLLQPINQESSSFI